MPFGIAFDVNAMQLKFQSISGTDYIVMILDFLYARCYNLMEIIVINIYICIKKSYLKYIYS